MPATPDDVFALLDRLGVAHGTRTHAPAFTVADSKHLTADMPGLHAKNLCLKDKKGRLFLVVAEHDTVIDLKSLHTRIGGSGRLSFVTPEQLMEIIGVEPGSVSPFALINDTGKRLSLVLDRRLTTADPLNFHPLRNTMTTAISREGFARFCAHTGHQALVMDLDDARPADGQAGHQHPH